jgi:hypothetical protein
LFNPRNDRWTDHFLFVTTASHEDGIDIRGITDVGRTTARLLDMNNEIRKKIRYELSREGNLSQPSTPN